MIRDTLCSIHQVSRAAAGCVDKKEKTSISGILQEAQEMELAFKIQSQEQLYKEDPSRSILSRIYQFVGAMLLRNNPLPCFQNQNLLLKNPIYALNIEKEMQCFKNGDANPVIVGNEACRLKRELVEESRVFPWDHLIRAKGKNPATAQDLVNREIFKKKDSESFLGGLRLSPVEGLKGEPLYRTGTITYLVNHFAEKKAKERIVERENIGRKALTVTALSLALLGVGTAIYAQNKK